MTILKVGQLLISCTLRRQRRKLTPKERPWWKWTSFAVGKKNWRLGGAGDNLLTRDLGSRRLFKHCTIHFVEIVLKHFNEKKRLIDPCTDHFASLGFKRDLRQNYSCSCGEFSKHFSFRLEKFKSIAKRFHFRQAL